MTVDNELSITAPVYYKKIIREGWWYIGIKGDGDVKSKGTRLLIEKRSEIDFMLSYFTVYSKK